MNHNKTFPDDFLWGASTASHQVEGGTHNQWSEWEIKNANDLARTAEKRLGWLPDWPQVKDQATDPQNYISGPGVEHYTRYKEDFGLLQELGLNTFRFGIEWSRVQSAEDTWDEAAIKHYHDYIDELNRRGIEPVLTLWHWTMPTWFTDKGGFEKKGNLRFFDQYAERMVLEFNTKVRYVITLNEPSVYASFSYLSGEWPPQHKSVIKFMAVYYNLVRAHRRSFAILKRVNPTLQIGIAAQLANMQPKRPGNLFDRFVTKVSAYCCNWWFLTRIRNYQDFIGLNYYFTNYYHGFKMDNPSQPTNDLGWYMEPTGKAWVMRELARRYHKPILITEDGVADGADQYRQWWLEQTIEVLREARGTGIDVIGYLHWSLLDNFEWKYGWWPKFGLINVNREDNMRRTIRPSARWLQNYIASQSKRKRGSTKTQEH